MKRFFLPVATQGTLVELNRRGSLWSHNVQAVFKRRGYVGGGHYQVLRQSSSLGLPVRRLCPNEWMRRVLANKISVDQTQWSRLAGCISTAAQPGRSAHIDMTSFSDNEQKTLIHIAKSVFPETALVLWFSSSVHYRIGSENSLMDIHRLHALVSSNIRLSVADCIVRGWNEEEVRCDREDLNRYYG